MVAGLIVPKLARFGTDTFMDIEQRAEADPLWWDAHNKRRVWLESVKARAIDLGQEVPEAALRLLLEHIVLTVDKRTQPPTDIGDASDEAEDITV